MSEECLFCKVVSREIPSDIVSESEEWLCFKDINPQAPVHVLIVPKKHIKSLDLLEAGDAPLFSVMMTELKRLARELKIHESGYRIVLNCNRGAGQTVWHLHLHLLGGRPLTWPPG